VRRRDGESRQGAIAKSERMNMDEGKHTHKAVMKNRRRQEKEKIYDSFHLYNA
jgi:hypothetical protein